MLGLKSRIAALPIRVNLPPAISAALRLCSFVSSEADSC